MDFGFFARSETYANKPRNRVSHQDKTAKIQIFSSETRFLRNERIRMLSN